MSAEKMLSVVGKGIGNLCMTAALRNSVNNWRTLFRADIISKIYTMCNYIYVYLCW